MAAIHVLRHITKAPVTICGRAAQYSLAITQGFESVTCTECLEELAAMWDDAGHHFNKDCRPLDEGKCSCGARRGIK